MPKELISLDVCDLSGFARSLGRQLAEAGAPPSHLRLMNMLARAAGYRNLQNLRARRLPAAAETPVPVDPPVDHRLVERVVNTFDGQGRMIRWPARRPVQELCLWALWSQLPAGVVLTERAVNEALGPLHLFGDPAILRRELCSAGLFDRRRDGSNYIRQERRPAPAALAVIGRIAARRRDAVTVRPAPV